MSNYNRVREWRLELNKQMEAKGAKGLVDPVAQLMPTLEELKEYRMAETPAQRMDAIGDIAVTAIVEYEVARRSSDPAVIEDWPVERFNGDHDPLVIMGTIAEGLRKPKLLTNALNATARLLQYSREKAGEWGYLFGDECLGPVCDILEGRLKEGYTMHNNTAVKKGDS